MKSIVILSLCVSSLVLVQCNSGSSTSRTVSNGSETVKITDSDNTYTLDASFDEGKTTAVFRRVNESLTPNALFNSEHDRVDATASLSKGGEIHIKASSGELTLTFDKTAHSDETYHLVKELAEDVKKVCDVR